MTTLEHEPVQQQHHHYYRAAKSGGTAAILEILPGLFLSTFGIGHMYAGNVGIGLLLMFGYWFLLFINLLLCFVLIGFITLPLTWLLMIIISPILAAGSCNAR
jgi:TM2 domain-containing membrane protein YozV